MSKFKFRLLSVAFFAFCSCALISSAAGATKSLSSADLPLEARDADSSASQEDDIISTSYVLPNQIFNDGKPYYASKDPISGQLDFNSKKPAGIEPEANEVIDPKEKIVLSSSSPNIHDFLNLPVKYSSSKFVYPLVSSSYANLKYQGSNKNYITNKKPTSVGTPVTPAPNYHSQSYANNYYTVPTTKLMAVPPTAAGIYSTSTTTSKKPSKTSTSSSTSTSTTTTTTSSTTSTTTTTTTPAPSSTPKYTTSSRKPLPLTTTTLAPRTTTTRKKFVPTKKYIPTTAETTAAPPMRFPTQGSLSTIASEPRPTATTVTTRYPTLSSAVPTQPTSTSTTTQSTTHRVTSTKEPVVFTEDPSDAPAFSPFPSSTHVPNLDPADVYQTLGQKNTAQKIEQKPSMTLADIFNSLAEEESAVSFQNQGNQGFDAQGNLIQPIAPSQPSPFAIQHSRPQTSQRPTFGTTPIPQKPQLGQHDQNVISGSQENYSNEYVSYQVQQPNVMQYRPVPGTINNVVISPGQNSATFVLGSQQQVGTNAFGSIEKEPLFAKEPSVQYGTVINEDISTVKRPSVNAPQNNYPPAPAPTPYQQMPSTQLHSNFHQNGNFPHAPAGPATQFSQRPTGPSSFQEAPPAPPSPYQQLPLVNSNARPQSPQQQPHSNFPTGMHAPPPQHGHLVGTQPPQTQANFQQVQTNANSPPRPHEILHEQLSSRPVSDELDTQELLVSTNIRFPANEEQSDEIPSVPVVAGPPAGPHVNGHAQPLSLQQIQQSNPVVFPKTNENSVIQQTAASDKNPQLNEIQFQGEIPNEEIQILQHQVLTMNQHKQKLNFPQSTSEQHTPSQHMEPPPRFPTAYPGGASSEPQEAQKRPQPNRPQQHPGPHPPASFMYNEYIRKPIPGMGRPNSDRNLPNILPQFRPNAKLSSGHPPTYNQEPGNIRVNGNAAPPKRPNGSPQFAHRHQPLPQPQQLTQQQPQRYPMKRIAEYPAGPPPHQSFPDANRRVYRLPPYGGQHQQFVDRVHGNRPMHHMTPPSGNYPVERHAMASNQELYQTLPQMSLEKMAAFEEEDLVINDPPQPVTPSKERLNENQDKLEPVVTLQMLQTQKSSVISSTNEDTGAGEIQVPGIDNETDDAPPFEKQGSQNGLYVVYPMRENGAKNNTAESMPAIAHIEAATTGSEYQNTPFSVIRDQPQEPILNVKNKKLAQSQQQHQAKMTPQVPKDKFPYPIEKPDPSYSELHASNRVPGVLIAPRIINGAYGSGSEAPIAIAYSPTEPNPYRHKASEPQTQQLQQTQNAANKYSNVNLASSVISEIRPSDTQTEEGLNNDFDVRGQNYEKDFMAPFYPSVSLGSATNTPSNGWNILPSSTDNSVFEKNSINRADVGTANEDNEAAPETTTKSFQLDSFQPELQSGFKPIYPPGYKMEDEGEVVHLNSDSDRPIALASRMDPPAGITTSSTSTTTTTTKKPMLSSTTSSSTTTTTSAPGKTASDSAPDGTLVTTTTTPKPALRKKSTFETSLAALLFGEDEDFEQPAEGEARKETSVKAVSGPRALAPRSGPRSLRLS